MDLLAERLTKRRQALKLQKKMVADRIGMTPQAYNHYEAGTRQPSYPVILLLSLALETSVSYLTGQSDDPAPDRILLKINEADDIAEYLGLSYASLGMTKSIAAFTEALLVRESDTLLLAIAEQYYKAKELNAAEQYLFRIVKNSDNEDIIIKSENLLGSIYIDKEDYEAAQAEFDNVLKKNENSVDAHYGIGVIYEKQGNIVKARSEWRKALKIQVNHPGALQKMSEN